MKTTTFNDNTIVAFHIGRGGRFNNGGHLTFLGEGKISDFTEHCCAPSKVLIDEYCNDTLVDDTDPNAVWTDMNGNEVDLTNEEYNNGIGRIVMDGEYDTTYTMLLKDVDRGSQEWDAILASSNYDAEDALAYLWNQRKYQTTNEDERIVLDAIRKKDDENTEYVITEAITDGDVILFLFEEKDGYAESSAVKYMDDEDVFLMDDWQGPRPANLWEIGEYNWMNAVVDDGLPRRLITK